MQKVAREAARLSAAPRSRCSCRPIELALVGAREGDLDDAGDARSARSGPSRKRSALLLATNEAALKVPKVKFVTSGLQLLREVKTLLTTEGTNITQTFIRVGPDFNATAVGDGEFQSFAEELSPRGQGWEHAQSLDMPGNGGEMGVARGRRSCLRSRWNRDATT